MGRGIMFAGLATVPLPCAACVITPLPPLSSSPCAAGVGLSVTLASLCAVAAMAVYVRRQRVQLAVLQRERSAASFSEFMGGGSFGCGAKLAGVQHGMRSGVHSLHVFAGSKAAGEHAAGMLPLAIPAYLGPDEHGAYIQVRLRDGGGGRRKACPPTSSKPDQLHACLVLLPT